MKSRVFFMLAIAGTVLAMAANLGDVAAQAPGMAAFLVTSGAAALWLTCASQCGESAILSRAALAVMLCMAAAGFLGLIPSLREGQVAALVWMLSVAPFYGFGALGGGTQAAVVTGCTVCVFVGFFCESERRRRALRHDADIIALERETVEPTFDPEMGEALERKAKKLLGLRDPIDRLRGRTG